MSKKITSFSDAVTLTFDLENLIRSGHYHYQCVYQIWEQSIPWFLSYRVNTIAGGGRRVAGDGRRRLKTITSPDPSDTGDIIILKFENENPEMHCGHSWHMVISKYDHENPVEVIAQGHTVESTSYQLTFLFVPCQSVLPFLRHSYFKIWPWKFNIKVMSEVKVYSHNVGHFRFLRQLALHNWGKAI